MDQRKQDVERLVAVITGASQGIGYSFSKALAKRGHNLVMLSLPGEKLTYKAQLIESQFGVRVYALELDLTIDGNALLFSEWMTSSGLVPHILINNAGLGSCGPFTEFDCSFYHQQIRLNCEVPVTLCRLFVPKMKQLREAFILNISSLGAFFPMPNKEVYVASKAFLVSFGRSLHQSLKGSSLSVTTVCPGGVNSNARLQYIHREMKGIGRKTILHPDEVADESLQAMFARKKMIVPGRMNRLLYWLHKLLPSCLHQHFINKEMARQILIRPAFAEKPRIE